MFGGLELKGASDDADNNADPAPAVSSFGFMNADVPASVSDPSPDPAPAAISSFSFLNSPQQPPSEPALAPAPEAVAAPAMSGFSFMMQEPTTTIAPEPSVVEETPQPEAVESTPAVLSSSSGFDFMNSMSTPAPAPAVETVAPSAVVEEDTIIPTIAEEAPAAPPAISGFSFLADNIAVIDGTGTEQLQQPQPQPQPTELPATIHTRTNSHSSISSALSTPSLPSVPTQTPAVPVVTTGGGGGGGIAGAGVTFGTSSAKPRIKKKKIRSSKIGVGASHADATTTAPPPAPVVPAPPPAPAPAPPQNDAKSARDAALEATKKAEAFMQSKAMSESRASPAPAPATTTTTTTTTTEQRVEDLGLQPTASTDEVLVAAKEAAQKAKIMQHQQHKGKTSGGFMGTFFKGFRATGTSGANSTAPPAPAPASSFVPIKIPPTVQPKATPSFQPVVVPTYGEAKASFVALVPEPKKNTPKDIFEGYQEFFSQSVNAAMRQVEDARNLKKGLLEERFVAMAKNRFATREIEQIEELLQAAIDEEDYEQADELGQKLDAHQREKTEVVCMLKNNENALQKFESEKISLGGSIASCFEALATRLDELKTKEIASEKKDDNETLTQYATISKQLSDEHERLQQDLKHLERDEQLVAEERKELENSINEQTGEIETEKENASAKLKDVEVEIEELRKALEKKQKEAAALRTRMFGFEDSISKVRVKFSRQLNRVNNKEMTVTQNRREWEIENEQYTKQKEAHDLQVESHSNALLAHEELMDTLESELKLSREFSEIIPTQLGFVEQSEEEENDSDGEESLAQLKANVVKCEGEVDDAKKALKMTTTLIQNLEIEQQVLAAKIPVLEKQKKAAAAGRDFKAAGKFSKEIKDAASRIQQCEEELNGDARAKKAAAEEQLRRLDSELLEANKIADKKEKLSGEKRMVTLAEKIEQLITEKKERCGEASSEGNTVKCVAARIIENQIAMLRAEGNELGSKYGGWDALVGEIDAEQGGESSGAIKDSDSGKPDGSGAQESINAVLTPEEMRERLAKAKSLIARCADLEEKVQEAADREDFETAGEFQEELDNVNNAIEEMNITDEECELLAQDETTLDAVAPSEPEPEESGLTPEEAAEKARELMTKQSELEEKVQDAAEEEDFDAAEEFQDELDNVISELQELNIPDDLNELLTKEEEDSPSSTGEVDADDDVVPPAPEHDGVKETISDDGGDEEKKEQDQESGGIPSEEDNIESAEEIPPTEDESPESTEEIPTQSEPMEVESESEPIVEEQLEAPGDTVEPSE
eukprot:jgi/Psemu1/290159/fgenesh1_pg.458_\